jgi:hypothetical protein
MDLQTSKIELAKLILNIESPNLISKIKELITKESSDFWTTLSDSEKEEIYFGLDQLKKGQRVSLDDYLNKV